MTSTSSNEKVYKKFFLQRSILDTIRVYVDLNDDFFKRMSEVKVIPAEELQKIKELTWPLNRNYFLQIIVKLPWNKESFEVFCHAIEKTQEQPLKKQIVEKANELLDTLKIEENKAVLDSDEIFDVSINSKDGNSMRSQNLMKTQLRDKDEKIRTLEDENVKLKTEVAVLHADNRDMNGMSATLDKQVMDMLNAIGFDVEQGNMEILLTKVSSEYLRNMDKTKRLNRDVRSLKSSNKELRERVTEYTEENIALKSQLSALQEKYASLLMSSKDAIERMTNEINACRITNKTLSNDIHNLKLKAAEKQTSLDAELGRAQSEANDMRQLMVGAYQTRDSALSELNEITDKARKLMASLDLLSYCGSTELSLDHARNIVYARRRRGVNSVQPKRLNEESMSLAIDLNAKLSPAPSRYPTPTRSGSGDRNLLPQRNNHAMSMARTVMTLPVSEDVSDCSSLEEEKGNLKPPNVSRCNTPAQHRCKLCKRNYYEESNYEGACLHHPPSAKLLNKGTSMEIWSCCKSKDTMRGCLRARHESM